MGLERSYPEMNFDPAQVPLEIMPSTFSRVAERAIINTILDGSRTDDQESATPGLRFIRYLLTISRSARFGFLPNFHDVDAVTEIARQFIRHNGGAANAIYMMHQVIEAEA